jgi:hypothetical protein
MAPVRRPLVLEVIDHEESVNIERQAGPSGEPEWRATEDGRTAFIHLRAPDGSTVRAEIPQDRLDHLLGFMFPELQGAV